MSDDPAAAVGAGVPVPPAGPLAPAGSVAPTASTSAARSALARGLSLVPTAIATLVATRIVISHFGIDTFDAYAVIVSAIALLPLNNLGVGAAVTNAFAASDEADRDGVTLTSARALAASTAVTIGIAAIVAAFGAWPSLLGGAAGSNAVCGAAIAIWAVGFVPGLAQNVLLGMHKNHVTVLIQAASAPVVLLLVAAAAVFDLPSAWAVTAPAIAVVAVNLAMAWAVSRARGLSWTTLLRRLPFRRRHPGRPIRAIALPLLITSVSVPIALQSDRIVLSHVSTDQAVADYTVTLQLFAPVLALVGAAAQPLWPVYAAARARGEHGPNLTRVVAIFVGAAAAVCAVVVALADPLGRVVSDGAVRTGVFLPVAAALSMIAQAATYPIAMSLMHPRGARFIAVTTTLSVPVNIAVSIVLGRSLGAPGPLLATAGAGVVFGVLAPLAVHRRLSGGLNPDTSPARRHPAS